MTKQNSTDITIILDSSSSMAPDRDKTLSAINEFLDIQKKTDGDCRISLVTFSAPNFAYDKDWYKRVWDGMNIKEIAKLSKESYDPSGWTALYDAVGQAIDETGRRLSKIPESERPSKVLFVTMTDGEENKSRTFSLAKLKESIQHQETKYSWNFVFLGADFSTAKQTSALGLDADRSMDFSKQNMASNWRGLSRAVSDYRGTKESKLYSNFADTAKTYASQE